MATLAVRRVSWFLTPNGRNFVQCCVYTAGTVGTLCYYLPQTFCISQYVDIVHLYKNGVKTPVSPVLMERFTKALGMLNILEVHKNIIKPFNVFGYDVFHAGSTYTKYGVQVGIPDNFNYQSENDIDLDQIQVNGNSINWSSEAGTNLKEALVVPEKLQLFGMCREILMGHSSKLYVDSATPTIVVIGTYFLGKFINSRLNFYAKPASLRFILYSLVSTFGAGVYFLIKDVSQVYYESRADKMLTELGPEMTEAGLQFYDKILKRNIALRHFMGKEGEKLYSPMGNENFFIRHKRIPVTMRKQFFEESLNEQRKKNELQPIE